MNTAFVFAKPHANTPAVLEVIKAKFGEKAINVLKEGDVTGEEIDSKGYIDQHYYAIAEKSTLTSGKDLPVNAEKFEGVFGEDWKTVVSEGRALNALEFKKAFAIYQPEGALDKAWDETNVDKKTRVKLGGGFYCGQITVEGVKCARHRHAILAAAQRAPVPPFLPPVPHTWLRPLTALTHRAGTRQVLHVQRLLHDDARQVHRAGHEHPLLRRRVRPDEAVVRAARSEGAWLGAPWGHSLLHLARSPVGA